MNIKINQSKQNQTFSGPTHNEFGSHYNPQNKKRAKKDENQQGLCSLEKWDHWAKVCLQIQETGEYRELQLARAHV